MGQHDRVRQIIEPLVHDLGLVLYDLTFAGSNLSVVVDRPRSKAVDDQPGSAVDLAALTAVTRAVSRAMDDADPIAGHYTLEVSTPGLERPLRTPEHFAGAVGEQVSIKAVASYDGPRRMTGTLLRLLGVDSAASSADHEVAEGAPAIELIDAASGDRRVIALADIDKARTVFEWGPEPKPAKGKRSPSHGPRELRPSDQS